MGSEVEALVVCGDKSMGLGLKILDIKTGENILNITNCSSPSSGLVCLRNQFIAASQINKHESIGGGAIGIWALNKPQQPFWNYTLEAIGPISCTKDGTYLVGGGALTGNAYLWDVTSGKLLKTWSAHNKCLKYLLFSDDDSLLISGSDDGMICIWSLISLFDVEETGSLPSLLHCLSGHSSTITGLLTTSSSCFSVIVSSSLDGSCKVWDFISGSLMKTQVHPMAITSLALHQGDGLLFYGSINGHIIVNKLDVGFEEGPSIIIVDQSLELKGHSGAVTALTFSQAGLISASEDCAICIWDIVSGTVIRRFCLEQGKITNLAVVLRSSMQSTSNSRRVSNQYTVSSLDRSIDSSKGTTTILSSYSSQHVSDVQGEKAELPLDVALQMQVETSVDHCLLAMKMTKHVMEMNKHLQSQLLDMMENRLLDMMENRLLDMMENRLFQPTETDDKKSSKKKLKSQSVQQEGTQQS